jgi:hypothetical protein
VTIAPRRNSHSFEVSVTTDAKEEFGVYFDFESISRRAMLGCYSGKLAGEKITMCG